MRSKLIGASSIAFLFALAGCGGSGGSSIAPVTPAPPSTNTGGAPQSFNAGNVKITEVTIPADPNCGGCGPVDPDRIDIASDGSVYFGASSRTPGPYGLFRYAGGAFTETQPHGRASNVFAGGVDSIDAHDLATVFWNSLYQIQPSAVPQGDLLQCGGSGGIAAQCTLPPPAPNYVYSMLIAQDGTLWAGGDDGGGVPMASPAQLPSNASVAFANGIDLAKGPNNHIWGVLTGENGPHTPYVYEFSNTGAVINAYVLPTGSNVLGNHGLIEGTDGALWFPDSGNNAIGRITASGQIHEYPIPTAKSGVLNIALAPDGGMWFTEISADKVGRIDTSGKILEFNVPTANAGPSDIAAPPTHSSCNPSQVWFTEANANMIASITY